jgi:ParB-like chromosome segregation protein Spo0J
MIWAMGDSSKPKEQSMTDQSPLPSDRRRAATRIVRVDPNAVRISALNPRVDAPITPESVSDLAAEMRAAGQINDAHGEEAPDGVIELFAGARRRVACLVNGTELRVRVHFELSRQAAIKLAYRDDRGSLGPSFWDLSGGWAKLLADGTVETDAALAELVDVDTGTMSRGMALRNAPKQILAAFGDVRAISQRQWMDLAPLVGDEESRTRSTGDRPRSRSALACPDDRQAGRAARRRCARIGSRRETASSTRWRSRPRRRVGHPSRSWRTAWSARRRECRP